MNTLRIQVVKSLNMIPEERLGEVLDVLNYLLRSQENHKTRQDRDWLESDLSGLENS